MTITNWKNETALVNEGSFGSGFWKWSLTVDFEDLQDGKGEDAITVSQDYQNNSVSFAVFNGTARQYSLPDGTKPSALQAVIDDIVARADELTQGFSVEVNHHNNRIGRFEGVSVEGESFRVESDAEEFWNNLGQTLAELDCINPYDLEDSENLPYVTQAVKDHGDFGDTGTQDELAARIETILYDIYEDNEDWKYFNFGSAAQRIAQDIVEDRDED